MPKPTPRPISPTVLGYTLGVELKTLAPSSKPKKKSFTTKTFSQPAPYWKKQ